MFWNDPDLEEILDRDQRWRTEIMDITPWSLTNEIRYWWVNVVPCWLARFFKVCQPLTVSNNEKESSLQKTRSLPLAGLKSRTGRAKNKAILRLAVRAMAAWRLPFWEALSVKEASKPELFATNVRVLTSGFNVDIRALWWIETGSWHHRSRMCLLVGVVLEFRPMSIAVRKRYLGQRNSWKNSVLGLELARLSSRPALESRWHNEVGPSRKPLDAEINVPARCVHLGLNTLPSQSDTDSELCQRTQALDLRGT